MFQSIDLFQLLPNHIENRYRLNAKHVENWGVATTHLRAEWMYGKKCEELNIRTVSKTTLTLRRYLTMVKTPVDPINTKEVGYWITCKCGRAYVGETGGCWNKESPSIQECWERQQWTIYSSTCSQNLTWDKMGWSGSCMQGRKLDETKDLRKFDDQGTWQQPQLRRCMEYLLTQTGIPLSPNCSPSFNSLISF